MEDPLRRPDFGPLHYDERTAHTGASVIGARNFLIAVNFNLDSTSVALASEIARDVRESGRKVDGVRIPGTLKGCKAIGWYIEEYGIAQVSMNITDIHATPLHKAYEEVCRAAAARGAKVTGTEIIGLVPRSVLKEAEQYFGCNAIEAMHLDDLRPFNIEEKTLPI
jgi:glutamate formiminotransferase/formiminotetrahydrofolate cyclodeaminase